MITNPFFLLRSFCISSKLQVFHCLSIICNSCLFRWYILLMLFYFLYSTEIGWYFAKIIRIWSCQYLFDNFVGEWWSDFCLFGLLLYCAPLKNVCQFICCFKRFSIIKSELVGTGKISSSCSFVRTKKFAFAVTILSLNFDIK